MLAFGNPLPHVRDASARAFSEEAQMPPAITLAEFDSATTNESADISGSKLKKLLRIQPCP